MKNTIKRISDNKYLVSDIMNNWTDVEAEATQLSQGRTAVAVIRLSTKFSTSDLKIEKVLPTAPVVPPVDSNANAPIVEPPAPDMSQPFN